MTGRREIRRGFSLIELALVIAIAGVLMATALPNLRELLRAQQLKAAANDLFGAINLVRTSAIARGASVLLVPSEPAGRDWSGGWVVMVDRDGDRRPGTGDEVIAAHGPLAAGIAVDMAFNGQKGGAYIAYNGAGRSCPDTNPQASRPGTFSLFHGDRARRIKINMLGRARICNPAKDGASCQGAEPEP